MSTVKQNNLIILSLLCSSFVTEGMNKKTTAFIGGIAVYGGYTLNDTLKDQNLENTKNLYKKEIFSQGKDQIKNLNNAISEEIQNNIYGARYIMPKDLEIINPQLIESIEPKIEYALKSSIQSKKDALYDSAEKVITGGAIVIGGISGLIKKTPFNPKSMIKTVMYGATAGIATTCATVHAVESYPKEITHYALSLYDQHLQPTVIKEARALTRNSIQLTKTALKKNGSWQDRWIIQYCIKDNPLTPTLLTGVDKQISDEVIKQYNASKREIKNSIISRGQNVISKIVPIMLVGSTVVTTTNPTVLNLTTNGLLLITNSLVKRNAQSAKETRN